MKKTIHLVKDCAKLLIENHLQIFSAALIIGAMFGAISKPLFALSDEKAILEKIEKEAYNFHKTAEGIYRSGLISEEALPFLKEIGIKTVLSFDNHPKRVAWEKKAAESAGFEFVSLPWAGLGWPPDEKIEKAIALIEQAKDKPILVHCKHGQERTGVAIACWRIAKQGRPVEEVYKEMLAHGFRPTLYGHLKEYVYAYARKHGQENARINGFFERARTNILSFFYNLIKTNSFFNESLA